MSASRRCANSAGVCGDSDEKNGSDETARQRFEGNPKRVVARLQGANNIKKFKLAHSPEPFG